jgi:hypothetical protein
VNFKKLEVETGYTTNEPVQMADRSNWKAVSTLVLKEKMGFGKQTFPTRNRQSTENYAKENEEAM